MAQGSACMARLDELRKSGNLPSPKGVALEIMRLVGSQNANTSDIVRVLQADPALVGRVLKVANSAAAGTRRSVVALSEAVAVLGLSLVRQLALGFSLVSHYRNGGCKAFDYAAYWSRSLMTALAARQIARRLKVAAPDEMLACGLLTGVGSLAFATVFPDEYCKVISQHAQSPGTELAALERQSFGTDHTEVATQMLGEWGLPRIYVEAAAGHECPEMAPVEQGTRPYLLVHTLHVAAALSAAVLCAPADRTRLGHPVIRKAIRLGLDADAVSEIGENLSREWADWAPMFELPQVDIILPKGIAELPAEPVSAAGTVADYLLRILVVDDDRVAVELLSSLLESAGHTVARAYNGEEALEAAVRLAPQLLITDWNMPRMDGIDLCRTLRASQMGQSMHILIVTGFEDEEHLVQAYDAGIDDYLVKPVRPRTLTARLRPIQRVLRLRDDREMHVAEMRSLASELAVNNRQLQHVAMTDVLTGLPNRRHAFDRMDQEWAATRRTGRPLSCIAIDVDHFKAVNDTYGHDAGDALLRHVASVLRESSRLPDSVCRIGGEEFLVICPETSQSTAVQVAERLRTAVATQPIRYGEVSLACTISLGVAMADSTMKGPTELLRRADQAVYLAKREGRNAVCIAKAA